MPSTFINLPPPPSDPVTPSEIPGTPNSGTTSLSALSTVAIKDGHQGHSQSSHHGRSHPLTSNQSNTSTTTLDAERADRISRLAGLERVSSVRQPGNNNASAAAASGGAATQATNQPIGYFDATGNPVLAKERSTVGSASATGSMGGRTTWASGSDGFDGDKMSEDNTDALSQGGLSDDANASLVGFGEGANSLVDAPLSSVSTGTAAGRLSGQGLQSRFARGEDAPRNAGGSAYDRDTVDGGARSAVPAPPGSAQGIPAPRHAGLSSKETTERIVQERYAARDQDTVMGGSDQ